MLRYSGHWAGYVDVIQQGADAGLSIPQIDELLYNLRRKGWRVEPPLMDVDPPSEAVIRYILRRHKVKWQVWTPERQAREFESERRRYGQG